MGTIHNYGYVPEGAWEPSPGAVWSRTDKDFMATSPERRVNDPNTAGGLYLEDFTPSDTPPYWVKSARDVPLSDAYLLLHFSQSLGDTVYVLETDWLGKRYIVASNLPFKTGITPVSAQGVTAQDGPIYGQEVAPVVPVIAAPPPQTADPLRAVPGQATATGAALPGVGDVLPSGLSGVALLAVGVAVLVILAGVAR